MNYMDKKERFDKALKEYLYRFELHPLDEWNTLIGTEEYYLFSLTLVSYPKEDSEPHGLFVPIAKELAFLREIDDVFESKVTKQSVSDAISQSIREFEKFPIPDEAIEKFSDKIFETLIWHFESQAEALVPLYNIKCTYDIEMPLANSVLHSGDSQSLFAEKANHSFYKDMFKDMFAEIAEESFLRIPVTGDSESRQEQAEQETEEALKVLRFVTLWQSAAKGNKKVRTNPASKVSQWKPSVRTILFHQPDKPQSRLGWYSDGRNSLQISNHDVDNAWQFLGLDDINYHYQNIENPISSRVQRAITLYDNGTRVTTNWEALYHYVVSINVAIPTSLSNRDKLRKDLETLIKYGRGYVGTKNEDENQSEPEIITWNEMVKRTAEPFAKFYTLRSKILHGNEMSEDEISDDDVKDARELAHNAVRLIAKLARELEWKTYNEAKEWFRTHRNKPKSD